MTPGATDGSGLTSGWGAERLDLAAYLSRTGMSALLTAGIPRFTFHDLRELHRAHLAAIPFDNIDLVLDTSVSLEPEAIVDKLCRRQRGGCCHEHNLLFGLVLERFGLPVERLAARVRLGGEGPRPRTHMLLKTTVDGEDWLCDVGFGSDGYLEPLPARHGTETVQHGRRFRVLSHGPFQRSIDVLIEGEWHRLYEFTHEPQQAMDFTVAHHFLSTHPKSMLRRAPFLQRLTVGQRIQLRGTHLITVTPSEQTTEEITASRLPQILLEFGITLTPPDLAKLSRALAEVVPPKEA
ncbi:arylamine N-acetyltransferase family protein [Streptomyces microflavus]|uniref:arylamine N-acetyltransferase family protein n=1 Tax=Streptomyces microflavus TaxID=1919 RepID=UPI003803111C